MRALLEIAATIALGLFLGSILMLKCWAAPPEFLLLRSLWQILKA